jgi:hypothetical protein
MLILTILFIILMMQLAIGLVLVHLVSTSPEFYDWVISVVGNEKKMWRLLFLPQLFLILINFSLMVIFS